VGAAAVVVVAVPFVDFVVVGSCHCCSCWVVRLPLRNSLDDSGTN